MSSTCACTCRYDQDGPANADDTVIKRRGVRRPFLHPLWIRSLRNVVTTGNERIERSSHFNFKKLAFSPADPWRSDGFESKGFRTVLSSSSNADLRSTEGTGMVFKIRPWTLPCAEEPSWMVFTITSCQNFRSFAFFSFALFRNTDTLARLLRILEEVLSYTTSLKAALKLKRPLYGNPNSLRCMDFLF